MSWTKTLILRDSKKRLDKARSLLDQVRLSWSGLDPEVEDQIHEAIKALEHIEEAMDRVAEAEEGE